MGPWRVSSPKDMVRRKRPYVPKVRGCFECSQRRINCDKGEPSCFKCASRGIECSGLGIKYRFRDGFTPEKIRRKTPSSAHTYTSVTVWPSTKDETQTGRNALNDDNLKIDTYGNDETDEIYDLVNKDCSIFTIGNQEVGKAERVHYVEMLAGMDFNLPPSLDSLLPYENWQAMSPPRTLSLIEGWKEFLLTYFSDRIAPEMVVVDDKFNGWRHLVLPIAHTDDLVMNAVLAASAFHLSGMSDQPVADPDKLYARAINELLKRRDLTGYEIRTRQSVILAIVVLLVVVMVNGRSDFPIMFHLLQSAIDAIGGEGGFADGGEVSEFSKREIRLMRVYAAPLLSQAEGFQAITSKSQESFDCLNYYNDLYPKYSRVFEIFADLRQQAFVIYLERVLGEKSGIESTSSIEHFINTLKSLPEQSPGQHVLVWACFIAASESRTPEHRNFLEQFLERHYVRNGFGNLLKALELLKRIWAGGLTDTWPALLPEPRVFIM